MTNPKPEADGRAEGAWSAGTVAVVIVAVIVVIAAISYAINNPSTQIASGPSHTGAASSTVGQGTGTTSR